MSNQEEYFEALENQRVSKEHEMAEIVAYFNLLDEVAAYEAEVYGLMTLEKV